MNDLCSEYNKRKVLIQKRQLCSACYLKWWNKDNKDKDNRKNKWVFYSKEKQFIKNFFNHANWLYQPAIFRFNGTRYEPDFYDGKRGVFIEVAGSCSAFYANLKKYRQFIKNFPVIKFEVRTFDGSLIDISAEKIIGVDFGKRYEASEGV